MRRLFGLGAALTFALAVAGGATARGPTNQFAVGSAKTDMTLISDVEHASFSAHNTVGGSCRATGQIVYQSPVASFTANIVELVIMGHTAFFGGPITQAGRGVTVGTSAYFDVSDSGMPGGTGDGFVFEGVNNAPPAFPLCLPPFPGHPLTSGNVVIQATGLLP
jgi:hypothetical protein